MKGVFITFEGPDGSGKTTQLHRLAEHLRRLGQDPLVTREPGGTAIGDKIREIILSPENKEMADPSEVLLYAASRAQHVQEKILPALEQGRLVICDRFVDASVAYQAYGLGMNREAVEAINRFATSGLKPDRTYLLDVSPEISRERLLNRAGGGSPAVLDRIEQKGLDYHRKVREGFFAIAEAEPVRVRLVKADRSPDAIFAEILEDCLQLLPL
ncbi:dTMP kinase [Paenibacillus sp. CC-CFT747]|nr:dTMP kinase [Paenibacillus sp. CC-CFT747]